MTSESVIEYTELDRENDFSFYKEHLNSWYQQFGKCYVAIRNGKLLGRFTTAADAVENLAGQYPIGTYIVQKCDADESAYKIRVHSFMIV